MQLLRKRKPRGQPYIKDLLKEQKNMCINIAIQICTLYKSKLIKIYKNHRNIFNKVWNVHSINIHVFFQSQFKLVDVWIVVTIDYVTWKIVPKRDYLNKEGIFITV